MRTWTLILLASLLSSAGCATWLAADDTAEALNEVHQVNLENWIKVRAAQVAFYEQRLETLDSRLLTTLAGAKDGPTAAGLGAKYFQARARERALLDQAAAGYGEAVDNAMLAIELHQRYEAVRSRWRRLFERIPGLTELRIIAKAKAREYVEQAPSAVMTQPAG